MTLNGCCGNTGSHPIDRFLAKLELVRRSGNGWRARCPAHEDRHPSLSVHANNGYILVKCWAGCSFEEIVAASGVHPREMRYDDPFNMKLWQARNPVRRGVRAKALPLGEVVRTYVYHDIEGTPLFRVCRFKPKAFRQQTRNGTRWEWGLRVPRPLPLYRLPLLAVYPRRPVFICEGERDVGTLERLNLLATCAPMGAANLDHTDLTVIQRDRRVIILPDNDKAGRSYARRLCQRIPRAQVVYLPGLRHHGDVTDWTKAGGTRCDLLAMI